MGLPHDIEVGSGSFTGYEPSISIRLLGATLEQTNQIAPVLGDALLQDAVITAQPVNKDEGMPAFLVEKADGSDFSQEEGRSLTERINPEKDPGGINFNQPLPNALVFIDPEVFNSETYTEDADAAFYDRPSAALGDGYNIESLSQDEVTLNTLNMDKRSKRLGIKRVSADHPIYKASPEIRFMNRSAKSTKSTEQSSADAKKK